MCMHLRLYTGRPPFMNLHQTAALLKIINGERPERPSGFPAMSDMLWQHVTACWVDNPTARPLTVILVQNLVWPILEQQSLHPPTLSVTTHTESAILSARNLGSSPLAAGRDEPVSLPRHSRTGPPVTLTIADPDVTTMFAKRTAGHLGSGPSGSAEYSPSDFLWLDQDSTPSSCEGPPSPTLSLSSDNGQRVICHESAMREQRWLGGEPSQVKNYCIRAASPPSHDYPSHMPLYSESNTIALMRRASPLKDPSYSARADMPLYLNSYNFNSIAWMSAPPHVKRFPAITSSFSATYHNDYAEYNAAFHGVDDDIPLYSIHFPMKPGGQMDELITHYLRDVIHMQYALVDTDQIHDILCPSVTSPGSARDAAQLLAAIHKKHSTYRSCKFVALRDEDIGFRYNELMQVLHKPYRNEDDALAAISMIWSVLFDGGHGPWQDWLAVLYEYTDRVFRNCDPRDTLQNCDETTRFIIKTTIWFDVLAAVTTQKMPHFLTHIRQLYSPEVHDLALPPSPELSMLSVVGCENHIVWALAEASALAVWKRQQQRRGYLSIPELVARADRLDKLYLNATAPKLHGTDTDLARELSSNIFRAVTRVYVRSTVSGDFPHVPEINEAIKETIAYVRTSAEHSQKVYSSAVRSTVFAFFICGALTGDRKLQQEVITALCSWGQGASSSTVGTIGPIRNLLEKIWDDRANKPRYAAVPWQVNLREVNMLLA
ncbi:fungal-specific transcription factor domain-containing protein [Mycena vitilis]|nr:fungal-specific transcription factor domain-containing protein [Mycena vitilis]